jgi:hypothetical protein
MFRRRPRPRCLSDLIAANMSRPDPVRTPPVDLLQILMGLPG